MKEGYIHKNTDYTERYPQRTTLMKYILLIFYNTIVYLSCQHNVSSTLDTINKWLPATIQIIKFALQKLTIIKHNNENTDFPS